MTRRAGAIALMTGLLLAAPSGCRQVIGAGDYGTDETAPREEPDGAAAPTDGAAAPTDSATAPTIGSCGGFLYPDAACGRCLDAHCCSALDACSLDAPCQGLAQCEIDCTGDPRACRSECAERYQSTIHADERTNLAVCRATECAAECGQTCGVAYFASGCEECLERSCCAEWAGLSASAETLAYATCRARVTSEACGTPSEGVLAAWDAFAACKGRCSARCEAAEAPADWSCLGSVVAPPRAAGETDLRLFVPGRAGIGVRACTLTDPVCDLPLASGVTGPDGALTLAVPRPLLEGFYTVLTDASGNDQVEYQFPGTTRGTALWQAMVVSPELMHAATERLGPPYDMMAPHIHVIVSSCGGLSAEGVTLSSPDAPPDALAFYGDGVGLPVPGKTETDLFSNGGFVNVSGRQRMTIEARVQATGQLIARVSVNLREALHVVSISPSPDSTAAADVAR